MMKVFVPLFFYLICILHGFAQSNLVVENTEHYKVYDSFLSYENNNVFNGLEYIDDYRSLDIKNHKFYASSDFLSGFIVYNEQPYYNAKMKYDLLHDLVILEFVNNKVANLSLNSNMISQFVLNDDKFVRLPKTTSLLPFYENGFFKEAYKGEEYELYVKYKKEGIQKLSKNKVFYVFKDHEIYVLFYKNIYLKINSKKDIIELIPEKKAEISDYFNSNRRLYKKNKYQFFVKLFTNLN
ncbi:hypothetical protein AAFN75_00110 [Algibacter sp. AS12]|uniref:hypothetical protein n=1 Tax=Algibacter sp. AS12 TaxID=3135773 RepID=UPI00398A8818